MNNGTAPTETPCDPAAAAAPRDPAGSAVDAARIHRALRAASRDEQLAPLNAIVDLSGMLLEEAKDLDQESFCADLQKIHAAGLHLLVLVREVQDPCWAGAERLDPHLKQFQARARHDLLNALNPIINYCEMWLEEAEEQFLERFVADLRAIYTSGKRCFALIDQVLDGSTLNAPELDLAGTQASAVLDGLVCPIRPIEEPAGDRSDTEQGCLLVVDDNETNRDILSRRLAKQGHRVTVAENGRQALDRMQAEPFDLVLLDIMMPEMSGFRVLEHMKADPRLRHIPVIMISALDEIEGVVRCIEIGAEDYLPKPFNPMVLQARIGACLEKKRLRDREVLHLRQIELEKQRSDELLHVIFAHEIVEELKLTNTVRPRRYDNVAVLFADIVNFTPYCDQHPPEDVLTHLQRLMEAWEDAAVRHGIEKIKTIGDAFMAAGGLLKPVDNPVLSCVRCGLEMIAAAQGLLTAWNARVGIHVGQVVAGVIGHRQYLFDLWGDTVNTAARMESHGIPGSVTLSGNAWNQIAHCGRGESLGLVDVKGKGRQEMIRFDRFLA